MASWFSPRPFSANAATAVKVDADIVPMDSKRKITISWSGGKDSAFALFKLMQSGEYQVVHLHTVISADNSRVGLHGVHEKMIEAQASSLGIKLLKLYLPSSNDHHAYEELMKSFYRECVSEGIEMVMFGDIFLEDLKTYREQMLSVSQLRGIYPLWKMNTKNLMQEFLRDGFKTILCSANARYFMPEDLGKTIDFEFIDSLGPAIDVAGENGEFHTFVYDGPIFAKPIAWRPGGVVKRNYTYRIKSGDGKEEAVSTDFWFKEVYEG